MAQPLPWEESGLQTQAANAVVHVARTFQATPDEIWEAWTDPELFAQWFRPTNGISEAKLDVRPDGKYRITMDPQGELPGPADIVGTYLEVEPPERLVFTWGWELPPLESLDVPDELRSAELEEQIEALENLDSRVTVQLRPGEGGTEVTITHERLDSPNLRAFHIFGWEMVCDGLARFL